MSLNPKDNGKNSDAVSLDELDTVTDDIYEVIKSLEGSR